MKIVHAEF